MWQESPSSKFRSIRDAMGWVSRALGPDEFKRASLTIERMLCEATMVLMASTNRLPTYDADSDGDIMGIMQMGIALADTTRLYPDCVTLQEDGSGCYHDGSHISSAHFNEALLSPNSSTVLKVHTSPL
jgi:hypothetical protein